MKKYTPRIMFLEAITNTANKCANISKMITMMSRIVMNKENAILGITKYKKDNYYNNL